MPFKIKVIKEVQKAAQSLKVESPNEEESSEDKKVVAVRKQKYFFLEGRSTPLKKLVDNNHNIFQLIYMKEPTWDHHVVNFYNVLLGSLRWSD